MDTCEVKGCSRPASLRGRCGFHALQGYYRTEVSPGAGLVAVRLPRPPRILPADDRAPAGPSRRRADQA